MARPPSELHLVVLVAESLRATTVFNVNQSVLPFTEGLVSKTIAGEARRVLAPRDASGQRGARFSRQALRLFQRRSFLHGTTWQDLVEWLLPDVGVECKYHIKARNNGGEYSTCETGEHLHPYPLEADTLRRCCNDSWPTFLSVSVVPRSGRKSSNKRPRPAATYDTPEAKTDPANPAGRGDRPDVTDTRPRSETTLVSWVQQLERKAKAEEADSPGSLLYSPGAPAPLSRAAPECVPATADGEEELSIFVFVAMAAERNALRDAFRALQRNPTYDDRRGIYVVRGVGCATLLLASAYAKGVTAMSSAVFTVFLRNWGTKIDSVVVCGTSSSMVDGVDVGDVVVPTKFYRSQGDILDMQVPGADPAAGDTARRLVATMTRAKTSVQLNRALHGTAIAGVVDVMNSLKSDTHRDVFCEAARKCKTSLGPKADKQEGDSEWIQLAKNHLHDWASSKSCPIVHHTEDTGSALCSAGNVMSRNVGTSWSSVVGETLATVDKESAAVVECFNGLPSEHRPSHCIVVRGIADFASSSGDKKKLETELGYVFRDLALLRCAQFMLEFAKRRYRGVRGRQADAEAAAVGAAAVGAAAVGAAAVGAASPS